jgi:uncharacterized protein YceK
MWIEVAMRKIRFQPFVVSMMVIVVLTGCTSIRRRFVGLPGSPPAEGSRAVTDGGIKISGWSGKVDAAEQKAGMTISDARLAEEAGAFHITTGPAVSYWNTDSIVTGNYTVTATFNEPKFMNLNSHPHPYGVFIGGNDMGTSSQTAFYCGAYGDGRFIARGFGPAPFRLNGLFGNKNQAIHKASEKGQPVTQDIALSVKDDKITCSINGTAVGTYDKAALTGPKRLKSFDGSYGLRFAHNTDVFVTNFKVLQQ